MVKKLNQRKKKLKQINLYIIIIKGKNKEGKKICKPKTAKFLKKL